MNQREKSNFSTQYPSILMLAQALDAFLDSPHILTEANLSEIPNRKDLDVVLLGDALFSLSKMETKGPPQRFRFWVLSQSMKRLLIEAASLKSSEIGVVPRYKLFKKNYTQSKPWKIEQGCEFFVTSRVITEKNWALMIAVLNELQDQIGPQIKGTFCNPDLQMKSGRRHLEIENLISKYSWRSRPRIARDLGPHWIDALSPQRRSRTALLNLSTSWQEDFGVSIAQAQLWGRPCIISEHGAHLEVSPAIKIPLKIMGTHLSPQTSLRTQARGCAAYILKNWERGWKPNVREKPLEPPPQWVDKRRLEQIKGGLNQEIMQILRLCPPWTLSQQNPVARKILKILNKVS